MIISDLRECLQPYMVYDDAFDGEEIPVSLLTIEWAEKFISKLPEDLPLPTDIGGDPDGMVCFEWYISSRRLVTVSIDETGKVYYAMLMGDGVVNYGGDIDDYLIEAVSKLINKVMEE